MFGASGCVPAYNVGSVNSCVCRIVGGLVMKVRLLNDGGYDGLANVQFPVDVELEREGYALYYVSYDVIAALPGWFHHEDDTYVGHAYCFYKNEVEVVAPAEEKKCLADLFGENGHEAAERIGEAAAADLTEQVFGADRKAILISLVKDYGGAINDGCYESECGSIQAMLAAHEEEKRLLKEIIKMIEEGV